MGTTTLKILGDDGTTPDPLARHHCPACRTVTMAPLGQASVTCSSCGVVIVEEQAAVELYALSVMYCLSPEAKSVARDRDYAAVDSEVFSMMLDFERGRLCRRGG